jgi:hypothetical protein
MSRIFNPRQCCRARSQKPSTIRIWDAECRQSGLSAGIRKVRGRWQARKHRARAKVKKSSAYNQLCTLAPQLCDQHLALLDKEFDCLRDSEIEKITILWETSRFLRNHANGLVHSQSKTSSAQGENGQAHRILSESTEQPEISTLILNPPFETSPAFEVMKSLMLTLKS